MPSIDTPASPFRSKAGRSPMPASWATRLSLAVGLGIIFASAAVVAQTAPSGGPAVGTGAPQTGAAPALPGGAGLPGVQPGGPVRVAPPANAGAPNPAAFGLPAPGGLPSPHPPQLGEAPPPSRPLPAGTQPQLVAPSVRAVPQVATPVPVGPLPSPGPGPFTALQIVQSFQGADTDGDGQLSRAEAQNLRLRPQSFEEMDRNKDGLLTRSEYENAFR